MNLLKYIEFWFLLIFSFLKVKNTFSFNDNENFNDNTLHNSVPYIFYTDRLPDDVRFMPTLGNGHLGYTIFDDSIYMNGVYNGRYGLSHRARIPNYSNITLIPLELQQKYKSSSSSSSSYHTSYSLDVSTGVFRIEMENNEMKIIQLIYAHRYYTRAIINQIFIYRRQAKGALRINIRHEPGQRTEDIDFTEPSTLIMTTTKSNAKAATATTIMKPYTDIDEKLTTSNTMMRIKMMMKMITTTNQTTTTKRKSKKNRNFSLTASVFNIENDDDDDDDENDDDIIVDDDDDDENRIKHKQYKRKYRNDKNMEENSIPSYWSSVFRDNETVIHMIQGYTKEVEDDSYQKSRKHICCLWNHVPEEITLYEDQRSASYRFVMTMDELCSVAQQEMTDVFSISNKKLLNSHRAEWIEFWNDFSITVSDNNLKLGKAIYGSIFYLVNSLPSLHTNQPSNLYYGLSPTGLGRGGKNFDDYEGHSFWDTEIWMLPVITQMNSHWTRILLNYRYRMLDTAKDNAKKDNFHGSKFPWESAFTGTEVTQPCCPLVALQQHHITADIGFALQNYFSITYDIEWLHNEGCPLAENIAEFWASRVKKDQLSGLYDIKYVMGPDEDHPNVTNNVYTNVIAGYALKFGEFARSICSNSISSIRSNDWLEIAKHLKVLYDGNLDYHPQFEEYKINETIKQADAVLLGYPLLFSMKDSTRRNDLRIYENVTRSDGPAMSWAMHAINHLDIGDYLEADKNFIKSYENYVQTPFQVWTETNEGKGATNFLTGAGGFLQSIINGYAGVRFYLDRMVIKKPRIPPNSNAFKISGIKYLGSVFDIIINNNRSIIRCKFMNKMQPLILLDNNEEYQIYSNFIYIIISSKITIKPKTDQFGINEIYGK